MQEEKTPY